MITDEIIDKLTNELKILVERGDTSQIRTYIQYAMVIGLEQPLVTNKKTILMLDENNNLIKSFDRLIDAAKFVKKYRNLKTKIDTIYVEIWRALTNKKNSSYKYYWKYK